MPSTPDPTGVRTMGYYTKHDLPFYYKLYRTFAMSDRHFCAVLGPTFPNRHYLLAASAFGHIRNDFPTVATEFSQLTIFDLLDQAGVSWKVYYVRHRVRDHLRLRAGAHASTCDRSRSTTATPPGGTLPQVAFIDPTSSTASENDEHPPSNVQVGQAFVASVIGAFVDEPALAAGRALRHLRRARRLLGSRAAAAGLRARRHPARPRAG